MNCHYERPGLARGISHRRCSAVRRHLERYCRRKCCKRNSDAGSCHRRRGTNIKLAVRAEGNQNDGMEMPLRFVDDEYTPRLWAELYPVLRNIKTDELARKMLAYKNKPVESWRAWSCRPAFSWRVRQS